MLTFDKDGLITRLGKKPLVVMLKIVRGGRGGGGGGRGEGLLAIYPLLLFFCYWCALQEEYWTSKGKYEKGRRDHYLETVERRASPKKTNGYGRRPPKIKGMLGEYIMR
jgi:hypothetical protein